MRKGGLRQKCSAFYLIPPEQLAHYSLFPFPSYSFQE